jgi:hypothetical protein
MHTTMMLANECVATPHHSCGLINSYVGLMTDVPHILFEFSLEILTAPFVFVAGKWIAKREHRRIDIEHGVEHHSP